jgi:hypothetical protein
VSNTDGAAAIIVQGAMNAKPPLSAGHGNVRPSALKSTSPVARPAPARSHLSQESKQDALFLHQSHVDLPVALMNC